MKAFIYSMLTGVVVFTGLARAQSVSAREKLIGAWRLVWMEEQGADGKVTRITDRKGMLVYTRDGHISVQLMFPKAESAASSNPVQYAQGGYEASFGSYEVNEAAHTVTHRLEGSLVRSLVGKDLPRVFRFADGHLILRSARPDEHWSVTWEHY